MATKTDSVKNTLIADFKAVIHDAEELIKATADQTDDKIGAIRGQAEKSLRDARSKLGEIEDNIMERGKAAAKATDQLVHDKPWQSVALATAVGVMVGMLISRRN